jgi:hypothetical protein
MGTGLAAASKNKQGVAVVDNAELRAELVKSQESGVLTERFVELAEAAARLWYSQRSASGWAYAVDEIVGAFRVKLLRRWTLLDPQRNLFAWCQTTARRCGMDFQRKETGRNWRHDKAAKRAERMIESRRS